MMKKKIKITIFHCTLIYTGGGERIVFGQIDGLKKRGYDVSCFAPVLDREKCYPDIINKYPVFTFLPQLPKFIPFRHAILLLLTCLLAPFLAFKFKDTDLFIGENQPGTYLAFVISKVLGKPYLIYTCHPNKMVYPRKLSRDQLWKNQRDFYWLSLMFEPLKPILRILDRISFTSSKSPVLINGFFIGREFAKIYKTRWIGCPSGAPFIRSKEKLLKNGDAFKGEIEMDGKTIKKPYLLYVGRHEVWKSIDLAIKAMPNIVKKYSDVRLVVQGPFSAHTQDLKELAKEIGMEEKVIFLPSTIGQENLRKLYFNACVYVFPSKKEDFGIVIIEAMGAGIPVVAWNSGGPTDIVLNGQTGYLAKPFDIDDFSLKVVKILKDKRLHEKMVLASWQRVKEQFSWEKHLDILEREIKNSLGC